MRKREKFTFKLPLYPFTFGSCFYPPAFALPFQTLFPSIFFFSNKRKEKKEKEKENHRGKKNVEKEGTYLQALALPSYFCPFVSSVFS
jgi:hypothetical protein